MPFTAEGIAINNAKSVLSILVYAEVQRNCDLTSAIVGSGKLQITEAEQVWLMLLLFSRVASIQRKEKASLEVQ